MIILSLNNYILLYWFKWHTQLKYDKLDWHINMQQSHMAVYIGYVLTSCDKPEVNSLSHATIFGVLPFPNLRLYALHLLMDLYNYNCEYNHYKLIYS